MNRESFNLQTNWRLQVVGNGTAFCSILSNCTQADDMPSFFSRLFSLSPLLALFPYIRRVSSSTNCLLRFVIIVVATIACKGRGYLLCIPAFTYPRVSFYGCSQSNDVNYFQSQTYDFLSFFIIFFFFYNFF